MERKSIEKGWRGGRGGGVKKTPPFQSRSDILRAHAAALSPSAAAAAAASPSFIDMHRQFSFDNPIESTSSLRRMSSLPNHFNDTNDDKYDDAEFDGDDNDASINPTTTQALWSSPLYSSPRILLPRSTSTPYVSPRSQYQQQQQQQSQNVWSGAGRGSSGSGNGDRRFGITPSTARPRY